MDTKKRLGKDRRENNWAGNERRSWTMKCDDNI